MHKEIKKIIIPILVVMLFFGLTLSPVISANGDTIKEHQLTIRMQDISGNNYKFKTLVTHEQLEEFNNSVNEFIILADAAMDDDSPDGSEISDSEWGEIKTKVYVMIDLIALLIGENFPVKDTKLYVASVISTLLNGRYNLRQPVLSIGIGITWIPFYDYETMLGRLLRPVFIHHILGFSATFKLNPFVLGFPSVKYGLHRIRTFFFNGLLIDFASLGYERIIGPQVLIGFGFFTGFA